MFIRKLFLFCVILSAVLVSQSFSATNFQHLPRFWTNVGFSPAAPLPLNDSDVARILLSKDVRQNIEIIGALADRGVRTIRTHWILSLVKAV